MAERDPQAAAAEQLTTLLRAWRGGDRDAGERLFPVVHAELRRVAARQLRRERRGHTLQPTALAHEAYLRLAGAEGLDCGSRGHFFALAARVMRQVLVDHARRRRAAKRGGFRVGLSDVELPAAGARDVDVLDVEQALAELARLDAEQARVVELRYFGGLTAEETAEVMGVSVRTIKREWQTARAWLQRRLRTESG
jgi:RNA polymerase sigma factor (TIGR02999 family)